MKNKLPQISRTYHSVGNHPKKLEKKLERLAEEMKRSSKSVREKIQKEFLPRLKEKIEKLREQFQKFGREEELEPLGIQMEKIIDI